MLSEKIFSRDAKGNIRVWQGEAIAGRWRSITGLLDGNMITSAWSFTPAASQKTDADQAIFEMNAHRKKLLGKDYRASLALVDVPRGSIIKPMLANKYPGWIGGALYLQPKLDGMRCLANADGLWSRGNKPIIAAPHIQVELAATFKRFPTVIWDGELYNHDFVCSFDKPMAIEIEEGITYDLSAGFNGLLSILKKLTPTKSDLLKSAAIIQYHIYDCFDIERPSMRYSERMRFISETFYSVNEWYPHRKVVVVPTIEIDSQERVDHFHQYYVSIGYEGSMIRKDEPYEQKRSGTLLKNKTFLDGEFKLLRIEEGKGNWAGYAKRAVCETDKGVEFGAGIKGDQLFCQTLLKDPVSKYESVTIKHFGETPDGSIRFPIAVSFNEVGSLEKRNYSSKLDSNSTEEIL